MNDLDQNNSYGQDDPFLLEDSEVRIGHQCKADAGYGSDEALCDHECADSIDPDEFQSDFLFSNAINELRRIKDSIQLSERERVERVHIYLARVFALSMEGKRSPARHKALIQRAKIKSRSDTPHHKQTLRAMQKELGESLPKQSEHDWSVALEALEYANINEDEESVRIFLTEPITVSRKIVRGFDKARAVLKSSERLKREKGAALQAKKADKQAIFDRRIEAAKQRPLGGIEFMEHAESSEDLWVSVNRGSDVLIRLKITPESLENWVNRYGQLT